MSAADDKTPTIERTAVRKGSTGNDLLRDLLAGGTVRTVLAIFSGFVVGAVLIAVTSPEVIASSKYFFSRPTDTIVAAWKAISSGYAALFRGSVYNSKAGDLVGALRPLTETLRLASPLIASGLGIALSFRAGLFNIGGQGQLLVGVTFASYVSFAWPLPLGLHLLVAVVAGVLGASLWGAIAGIFKATSGAHEVIVTIMLNYIAMNVVTYLMRSGFLHDQSAGGNPRTTPPLETAQMPLLLGSKFSLHGGFVLAVAATIFYWWLMERSSIGYRFRTVGLNSHAARTAGMNVRRLFILVMASSAAFVGIAAVNQVLGRASGVTPSIDAGIGFDGITVALLGAGSAGGVFFAGLLFGAMKAGSPEMQLADISPEVLLVVQGVIVLFIAAPPLVRALFRLPSVSPPVRHERPTLESEPQKEQQ